jgi:hypothetical protein
MEEKPGPLIEAIQRGRLQASGYRDGLISHTCEREGPSYWQYHKVVAKLHFMARSGSRSVQRTTQFGNAQLFPSKACCLQRDDLLKAVKAVTRKSR